jgi:hypothetical protein
MNFSDERQSGQPPLAHCFAFFDKPDVGQTDLPPVKYTNFSGKLNQPKI